MIDEFNEKIGHFKASGLIDFWMSKFVSMDLNNSKESLSSLSLKHLLGTFMVLIYGLTIAFIVFIIELGWSWMRKSKLIAIEKFPALKGSHDEEIKFV